MNTFDGSQQPLLGVAGSWTQDEIELARRFDELHQLVYSKGGVRPTNAVLEEITKLVALAFWGRREPGRIVRSGMTLGEALGFDGGYADVSVMADVFRQYLEIAPFGRRSPDGKILPLWPADEPFRLRNAEVLDAALDIVREIVGDRRPGVADPLGTAFDALLSGRYDHAGGLSTYLTPSGVAKMMADVALSLLPQRAGHVSVLDPFCGTGRFLVAALEALEERGNLSEDQLSGIVGADQSESAVAKAAVNLMLYGASDPRMWVVRDSMTASDLNSCEGEIDIVLTNPPFGSGKYADRDGISCASRYMPSLNGRSAIDPALGGLALSLRLVSEDGVIGIVLPDGLLEGVAFQEVLKNEHAFLVGIVSLPTATFSLSGTVAKTSAVFLRKVPTPRIFVSKVEHVGFLRSRGGAVADPHGNELRRVRDHLKAIAATKEAVEARVVLGDQPLSVSVDARMPELADASRLDAEAERGRLDLMASGACALSDYIWIERKRPGGIGSPFVSVLHVDRHSVVDWRAAERYVPITAGQIAEGGDIIVSLLNPSKFRAAVVPHYREEIVCSSEFGVFKCKKGREYAVLALLQDPRVRGQLRPLGKGTSSSRRRVSREDLLELIVPKMTERDLDSLNAETKARVERAENSLYALSEWFNIGDVATD